jgi:hypothetical protein
MDGLPKVVVVLLRLVVEIGAPWGPVVLFPTLADPGKILIWNIDVNKLNPSRVALGSE